jgi:hypothetical protein
VTGNPDLPEPDAASSSHSALTYYGELVRRQWQGCLPDVYQQVRDPGAFFAVLGEVIAQRIDELADYLAGDDPPGEGYLAKVARLTAGLDGTRTIAGRWWRSRTGTGGSSAVRSRDTLPVFLLGGQICVQGTDLGEGQPVDARL